MSAIQVFVRFGTVDLPYSLDLSESLQQHILAIVQKVEAPGDPNMYTLKLGGTYQELHAEDLRDTARAQSFANALLELKLKSAQVSARVETKGIKKAKRKGFFGGSKDKGEDRKVEQKVTVQRLLDGLNAGESSFLEPSAVEAQHKKACFELQGLLRQDPEIAEEFRNMNGLRNLARVVSSAKGNTLTYALGTVQAYLDTATDARNMPTSLLDKLVSTISVRAEESAVLTGTTLNAAKSALCILGTLTGTQNPSPGALIYLRKKQAAPEPQSDVSPRALVSLLQSSADTIMQTECLRLINNLMETQPEEIATSGEYFEQYLSPGSGDDVDLVSVVISLLESSDEGVSHQILRFQKQLVTYGTRERFVTFDAENADHIQLLKRLWHATHPEDASRGVFPGAIGDHWGQLGFQGKNPATDFRAMGVFGLRHLVYFAENYPSKFIAIIARQHSRTVSAQYPVATAGIILCQTLMGIFRIGEAVQPPADPKRSRGGQGSREKQSSGIRSRSTHDSRAGSSNENIGSAAVVSIQRTSSAVSFGNEGSMRGDDDHTHIDPWATLYDHISPVLDITDPPDATPCKSITKENVLRGLLEVYCVMFEYLDLKWEEAGATYMEFQGVLAAVKTGLEEILPKVSKSLVFFRRRALEFSIASRAGGSVSEVTPTLPSAAPQAAAAPEIVVIACDRCEQPAHVKCSDCDTAYCVPCSAEIHEKGRWAQHDVSPLPGVEQPLSQAAEYTKGSTFFAAPPKRPAVLKEGFFLGARRVRTLGVADGPAPNIPSRSTTEGNLAPPAAQAAIGSPDLQSSDKNTRIMRQHLNEIIDTERQYVADLNIIIEVFYLPMKLKRVVENDELQVLFSNVETLVQCNSSLLDEWDKGQAARGPQGGASTLDDDAELLGQVFANFAPFLKMYTAYCSNHTTAATNIEVLRNTNTNFRDTLRICETDPRCKGLNLYSYLIKPVQRVCKYPMLIAEVVKGAQQRPIYAEVPEKFALLEKSNNEIDAITVQINEGKREAENLQRTLELGEKLASDQGPVPNLISPGRRLLREGKLQFSLRNEEILVEGYLFLFSDILLVTRERAAGVLSKEGYQLKAQVDLKTVRIVNVGDAGPVVNTIDLFYQQVEKKKKMVEVRLRLSAISPAEKNSWLLELKGIKKEFQKMDLLLRAQQP